MSSTTRKMTAAAAALLLATQAGGADRKVDGIDNAEDMAVLEGNDWVIVSSMAGGIRKSGKLVAVNVATGTKQQLYPNAPVVKSPGNASCPTEVAADAFKPHGIALQSAKTGRTQLYVVNHGGRESIEMFLVGKTSAGVPKLTWIGCAVLPDGAFGNGVAPVSDGSFYATNMGAPMNGAPPVSDMGGQVMSWSISTGWAPVPGSRIAGSNGITASPDGKRLYVASWTGGEIIELTPGSGESARRTLKVPFLPDNVHWSSAGTVLAAGHLATADVVKDCYLSTATHCTIPSTIAEIDPDTMTIKCMRPVSQGMATTALFVRDETWVGTARGPSIARLGKEALAPPNCK